MDPCHHGMARTRFADSGYGLQVCKVNGNVLNKQSWAAWAVDECPPSSHRKNTPFYEMFTQGLELGRILFLERARQRERWVGHIARMG